jgi:hypothetical protein
VSVGGWITLLHARPSFADPRRNVGISCIHKGLLLSGFALIC